MDEILAARISDRQFVSKIVQIPTNEQQRDNNPIFKKNQRLDQTPYQRAKNNACTYIRVSQHLSHQGNANYKHSRYKTKTKKESTVQMLAQMWRRRHSRDAAVTSAGGSTPLESRVL